MVANEMVKRRIHFLRLGTEKLGVWKLVNGYPKMDGELKWMIWGAHPYFWKQPNIPRLFCPSGVLFSRLPRMKFESNADKKSLLWPTSSTTSTADAADSDPWSLVRLNVTHVRDRQNEQARKWTIVGGFAFGVQASLCKAFDNFVYQNHSCTVPIGNEDIVKQRALRTCCRQPFEGNRQALSMAGWTTKRNCK